MESRANYVAVGAFFLILTFGLIGFVFWLAKYSKHDDYDKYYVLMNESVSGLNLQASVKYMGVNIGSVEAMSINPKNIRQVELLLYVQSGTPIKEDTVATLKFYGMTGLAFIELVGGSQDAPLLHSTKKNIAYIKSIPSTFMRVEDALSKISTRLIALLDNLMSILNRDNIKNFDEIMSNLKHITAELSANMQNIEELIDNGKVFEKDATEAFRDVKVAAHDVSSVAKRIEKSFNSNEFNIKELSQEPVSKLNSLLDEINDLTNNLNQTVDELKQSPSDILFKSTPPKPAPGE